MGCPQLQPDYFRSVAIDGKNPYRRFFRYRTSNDRSEVTGADATTDANYNFSYAFDDIGNRETYTTYETGSSVTSTYTSNQLNQYTAITNPTQSPTYDDDGNMDAIGDWSYQWNAENRLIVAIDDVDSSGTENAGDIKYVFAYDYSGRRVLKEKYTWDVTAWKTTPDTQLKFVYNGFEQIEELDGKNSDNIDKKRVWGGGKVICDIHGSTAYYALGDANKNITEYLDSSGTVQAHYEYTPFGKIYASSGTKKDDFDFRFSSEFYDDETGLVYYNYRYYSPEIGRWLSREPLGERGSFNLYSYISNHAGNSWDYLGQVELKKSTSGDPYREYNWPLPSVPEQLLPIEPQDPWPSEFLMPETTPIILGPGVVGFDPLDGKPCCENEAKVVTFTVTVKKSLKLHTAFITAKRKMTLKIQIDDARSIKAVFWRCHERGAEGNWGAISESVPVAPNKLNTITRSFSGYTAGTFITGVAISYYSCVGGDKATKKEGVWRRKMIARGGTGDT